MQPGAKNPESVFDKARECRYFLVRMAEHELAGKTENFLFCLSAFLSSFRSVAFRLYGVTETQRGPAAKSALRSQLHTHPQIGFLIRKSNVEIHEDGATVRQRYTVTVGDSISTKWPARWTHQTERWPSRLGSRYNETAQTHVVHTGWQFEGNQENLIALCHDALNEMESVIRQNTSVGPQVP